MSALQQHINLNLDMIDQQELIDGILNTLDNSLSPNTKRAYKRAVRDFSEYCAIMGVSDIKDANSGHVVAFLQQNLLSGKSISTLNQILAGISFALRTRLDSFDTPASSLVVKQFMQGARRIKADQPKRKAKPITNDIIKDIIADIDSLRDKALILLGWSGALRRSEIAAIRVNDLNFRKEGLELTIRKSKTDQEGAGQKIAIVNQITIDTLIAWLDMSKGTGEDYLFQGKYKNQSLTGQAVANIIKKYLGNEYSAHGLRSGFMTSAANHGVSFEKIIEVSRHKDYTVAMGYTKDADKFFTHAGKGLI